MTAVALPKHSPVRCNAHPFPRLRPYQQTLNLDPLRVRKAVDRARRLGISPPILLSRQGDGYLLDDGLYRLAAARALGMETIAAVVG